MADSWLKLYRKARHSAVFKDPLTWQVWSALMMDANWEQRQLFNGQILEPGQLLIGQDKYAQDLGLTRKVLRLRLKWLEKCGNVAIKRARNGTLVTICNWATYQSKEEEEGPASGPTEGQLRDNRGTTEGHERASEAEKREKKEVTKKEKREKTKKESKEGKEEEVEPIGSTSAPPPASAGPSSFSFPVKSGEIWDLPQRKLDEYLATYAPQLDVEAELRKARQWLMDHKDRRKTKRGMAAFLTGWLNRTSDKSPVAAATGSKPPYVN